MKARKKRTGGKGFTLLELLVATAVTTIVATLLLSISQNVLESQSRMVSGARVERDANFALDILGGDLVALAVPRMKGAEALRIQVETVNGAPNCRLSLLSNAQVEDPGGLTGSTRAVNYRVGYQDPVVASGAKPSFALYRTVSDVTGTFNNAIGSTNLDADYWASRPTLDLPSYLVGNVVDFRIRFFDEASGTWIGPTDAGDMLRITPEGTALDNGGGRYPLPRQAEISVTTLSRQGVLRLQDGTLTLQEAISRFGKTFSRQVQLPVAR